MRLGKDKIALAIKLLCESSGIRQTSRIVGIHQETVLRILKIAGTISGNFMQEKAKNLPCKIVAVDEIYSYVHTKRYIIKAREFGKGEHFTFLGVCQDSKFIINTLTDARTKDAAKTFLTRMKGRLAGRIQLNTDAWKAYAGFGGKTNSVKKVFGKEIDHVTEEKEFYKMNQFTSRKLAKTIRKRRIGCPDMDKGSTSVVERTNLNVRHFNRRFTRCTLNFSKKLINHRLAMDLFIWHSNFSRKHITLKTTPALALGLDVAKMQTGDLWNIGVGNN